MHRVDGGVLSCARQIDTGSNGQIRKAQLAKVASRKWPARTVLPIQGPTPRDFCLLDSQVASVHSRARPDRIPFL